jgi:hypothetical protein
MEGQSESAGDPCLLLDEDVVVSARGMDFGMFRAPVCCTTCCAGLSRVGFRVYTFSIGSSVVCSGLPGHSDACT